MFDVCRQWLLHSIEDCTALGTHARWTKRCTSIIEQMQVRRAGAEAAAETLLPADEVQQQAMARMANASVARNLAMTDDEYEAIEVVQRQVAQSQRRETCYENSLGFTNPEPPPDLGPPAPELVPSPEQLALIPEAESYLLDMVENIKDMEARFEWPVGTVEEALRQPTAADVVSHVVCLAGYACILHHIC